MYVCTRQGCRREHALDGEEPLEALHPIRDPFEDFGHAADGYPFEQVVVAELDRFLQSAAPRFAGIKLEKAI